MRKIKKKERELTRKRTALFVFYGILALILMGVGWRLYASLKTSVWDGRSRINLVFRSKPLFIASLEPSEAVMDLLVVPDGTFIEAAHGYGPYRVEVIYSLGELEGKGEALLADSLQEYLGVPLDAYVSPDKKELIIDNFNKTVKIKTQILGVMMGLFKGEGKTNLSRWDLLRLWWETVRLKNSKINVVNLSETSASSEATLPDGTKATKIEPERLDRIVNRLFVDEKIRAEDLTLAVLNSTGKSGLANQGARLIANIGGRVVKVGEIEGMAGIEKCQIRSEEKQRETYTVRKIREIFDCQWSREKIEGQRTEVVIILAEDYWRKLYAPLSSSE